MLNTLQELLRRGATETVVLFVVGLTTTVLAVGCLILLIQQRRLKARLHAITRNADGSNLEDALSAHMCSVDAAVKRMDAFEQAVGILQAGIPICLQKVNVVRFDAFEDVGGEQSFAVALLDARGDGVVLSSIYTRQDVRMYAKSVTGGQASHKLSKEEQRALDARG